MANKSDIGSAESDERYRNPAGCAHREDFSRNREGLAKLEQTIVEQVIQGGIDLTGDSLVVTRARHKQALKEAAASLEAARRTLEMGLPQDLIAIDIRGAAESLGEVTGESVTDEVIERIFADFCIGK